MKGIRTTIQGLAKIVPNKKKGEQPCTIFKSKKTDWSIAEMRVNTNGWFLTLKFDPSLIDGDNLAMVAGKRVYFEGHLTFTKWTKDGQTKESYFQYVHVTRLVHGEELSEVVLDLQIEANKLEAEQLLAQQAKRKALSAK